MIFNPFKAGFLSAMVLLSMGVVALAQNSPTPTLYDGTNIEEDFDALANSTTTLPAGFGFVETGSNANGSYVVGDGSTGAGDTYSFGVAGASDRALGSIQSNAVASTFGIIIRNDTGTTLTEFSVSYRGEQYRVGGSGTADRLDFAYSSSAATLNASSGFTEVDALDFASPISTAGAARSVSASTSISGTVTGLSIAPGATLVLRFADLNISGVEDGLAIDDFVFSTPFSGTGPTPSPTATPVPTSAPLSGALINEFRVSGPGGSADDFIEIYNQTNVPLDLAGWTVTSSGGLMGTIPTGKAIPPYGRLLLTGSGYSLANYGGTGAAAGDVALTGNVSDDGPLELRNASGTVVDSATPKALAAPTSVTSDYSYVRRMDGPGGAATLSSAFNTVDVNSTSGPGTSSGTTDNALRLGAPGPQNLSSPIVANQLITFVSAGPVVRTGSGDTGTLAFRNVITNRAGSGRTLTALRFRLTAVTSGTSPTGTADARLASSSAGGTVLPLIVETPPAQPLGGGLNTSGLISLSSLPGGGLAPGQSVTVEFFFNIFQRGSFRYLVNLEPATTVATGTSLPDDNNLLLGNPSGAIAVSTPNNATATEKENLLVEHTAFALGYQKSMGSPRWVSWHLDGSNLGSSGRNDNFSPDPKLPGDCQITSGDYSNSGYTRGHQTPSMDRTSSVALNKETFLMSNMVPQTATLNNGVWAEFETFCNDQARNSGQELYILSGGVGSNGRIAQGKVNIPASCWKVAVILPKGSNDLNRISSSTRVISILIPNTSSVSKPYSKYFTTVDNIESLTGLDLLSNLPDSVENFLEASTSNR